MYKPLGEVDIPLDQRKEFGRRTPLFVEIGFGNGSFIEAVASRKPCTNCIGAEVSLSSLNRAHKRLRRSGLDNVRLFRCDGRFLVQNLVGGTEIDTIAVNFPDPWPRQRHSKRRLLSSDFFELASTRLADTGSVCLATDDPDYFDFARQEASKSGLFAERLLAPPPGCMQTRYARKWLDQDRTIHYAEFHLESRARHDQALLPKGSMHHAFLTGDLPDIQSSEKQIEHTGTADIVIVDILHPNDRGGYVFAVLVEEDGLRQDVLVDVRPHRDGYHVGLMRFGSPVLTRGVSDAVKLIARMLEREGMQIEDTWY